MTRRSVSVVELSTQQLEKGVEIRWPSISPAESARDLAIHITNDGGEVGGGRIIEGDSTPERFSKGAFSTVYPNRGLQAEVSTSIAKHQNAGLGLLGRAHRLLSSACQAEV